MINQTHITVKIVPNTIKYWKSKGYSCSLGDMIDVRVSDLKEKSNVYVSCICDQCQQEYTQRYSRNTELCTLCQRRSRMVGNTLGSKNKKYATPTKEEILTFTDNGKGKSHIAEHYGVSIPVVDRWLKEHDIQIEKYHGRKYFTDEQKSKAIEDINRVKTKNPDWNITEISNHLSIPRHMIYQLKNEGSITLKTQFDIWQESFSEIISMMDFYIQENKSKDLKTIAEEQGISIEQLKKAFRETGNKVILHSYNKSKGELECRDFIQSLGVECNSSRIQGYEIDCFVQDMGLGVEYCGEYWHRYTPEKGNKYYHRDKQKHFHNLGIDLLTIFEHEWNEKRDIVESMIRSRLGMSHRLFARNCTVKEISSGDARSFHTNNHLSGYSSGSIHIGLFHEDSLMSVLSFVKSRFDKKYQYEISRFSTLLDYVIVGGLSKMFSYFVKTYDPESCMTYSDLRVGQGESYKKIGFSFDGYTPPNYFYYHKNSGVVESRHKFQKHKLKEMDSYSIHKSEYEIMNTEGYYRIYDCGNVKYIWTK